MASLVLGGGYGWLSGEHGLAIDNLVGATIVIADGAILDVSKDLYPDVRYSRHKAFTDQAQSIDKAKSCYGRSKVLDQISVSSQSSNCHFILKSKMYSCLSSSLSRVT